MEIHDRLKQERHLVPKTREGTPVIPALLDPYRCNFVAPDQLLTGLAKDILNTVFLSLPTNEMRMKADFMICAALRQNGLLPQNEIFNSRKNSINSMTLSEVFCMLLESCPILKIVTTNCASESAALESVKLLQQLHRLIAFTYWWPQKNLDGQAAIEFVHNNKVRYFSELKNMSKDYVIAVNDFCARSSTGKAKLDKPNLHRLVELYEHSIPAFGHAREFMELIFESAHQPLKRSSSGSNNHNPHIFAMEQCVANDWQGRIASLCREIVQNDPVGQQQARRSLRRVLLGREADQLHEERDKDFTTETDKILKEIFTPAIKRHFQRDSMVTNFASAKNILWVPGRKTTVAVLSGTLLTGSEIISKIVQIATAWINALFPATSINDEVDRGLQLYKDCKRVKVTDCGRRIGGLSGFDKVSSNCILQVYLSREKREHRILKFKDIHGTQPVFFVFIAALQRKGDHVWALCQRCSVDHECIQTTKELNEHSFQILCLAAEVCRIAVYHVCQDADHPMQCIVDIKSKSITHSLGGQVYQKAIEILEKINAQE